MENAHTESGTRAPRCAHGSRGGRIVARLLFAGALFGVVAAAAYVGASQAHPAPHFRHAAFAAGVDPETAARRVDAMVGFALADVDATPEQKQRIGDIARAALNDLAPMREEHRAARRRALDLLSAATVDRAALEQVRAAELALADKASRRMLSALADSADVLGAEQRQRLATRLKERHERRLGRS